MQKNFVQRHILFFSIIVFCFVFVPIVKNAYAQEKEINKEKIVIKEQEQQKQKEVIKEDRPIVVLDAGHGGYDDGSVSDDHEANKRRTEGRAESGNQACLKKTGGGNGNLWQTPCGASGGF